MSVISITITNSVEELMAGIPRTITISTNISSTIFYTLDGTDPTINSNIYVSPIILPQTISLITLKVYATNGIDNSIIVSETYETDILNNTRFPYSTTTDPAGCQSPDWYPFGTNEAQGTGNFVNPSGIVVDDPALPQISDGYDADGMPNNFSNLPFNIENYQIEYSTTDSEGQTGPGIGNLPGHVKIIPETDPPEETEQFSKLFDPRAMVIFQDFENENINDPPVINKQFFTFDNGADNEPNDFYSCGLDNSGPTGSFVRQFYNPRDNTMTYYYFDNLSCRWLISKTPYIPNGNWDGNLSSIKFGRGSSKVYEWVPGQRRVLF